MSQSIDWNISARANGGPTLAGVGSAAVDAYDRITVTIAAGTTQQVTIAPGTWTTVSMLVINPTPVDPKLSYNNGVSDTVLDGPHVLIGAGAVSLLGTGNANLTFKSTSAGDVNVDILVGRDATP